MNSILLSDGYKLSHHNMYPDNTSLVFSNFTPRGDKYAPKQCQGKGVVVFGPQMSLQNIHEDFENNFFLTKDREMFEMQKKQGGFLKALSIVELNTLKDSVIKPIKVMLDSYLNTDYDMTHFEELWDIGYLPIEVRALEEGTICPIRVPMLTVHNTLDEFFWLPNFLESIISNTLWKSITSATIARAYKKIIDSWAMKTTGSIEGTEWQGHDFSMRGLDSVYATQSSGLGHLTSFFGTDSLPTLWAAKHYYDETGFVAGSVPATEHSVMCAGSKESEIETFRRLLELYPTGILSIVSDTWDLWKVCTDYMTQLKEEILDRDGKIVIRPDSGDPVDIICGTGNKYRELKYFPEGEVLPEYFEDYLLDEVSADTPHGEHGVVEYSQVYSIKGKLYMATIHNICWNRYDKQYYFIDMYEKAKITVEEIEHKPEHKGVVELLWDVFGGTVNEQGFKVLDPHIGVIYGDSITLDRCEEICERLAAKGFASSNVVFGIGSYTYQFNTRDTFGFAMKATYIEKEEIFYASPESVEPGIRTVCQEIFKDPITDDGLKKSAKGLLKVVQGEEGLELVDQITWSQFNEDDNLLKIIYENGEFPNRTTLTEIRNKLK